MRYFIVSNNGQREVTEKEYRDLERALQWPEDLEEYDRKNKPTNLTELAPYFPNKQPNKQ